MKMFLLGAPCAGKTTLVLGLREVLSCPVLDMDEELVRVNGGTWPASDVKRSLSSRVLDEASALGAVVLAHSRLDDEQLASLVAHGWVIALLDVPEAVLRRAPRSGWRAKDGRTSSGSPYTSRTSPTSVVDGCSRTYSMRTSRRPRSYEPWST